MSLRTRIILLFVGLSVVPLLILAAVSYWHAQSLLENSLRTQVAETAETMGGEIWSHALELRRGSNQLAAGAFSPALPEDHGIEEGLEAELPAELLHAQFVRVLDSSGNPRLQVGEIPAEAMKCSVTGGSRLVRFSSSARSTGGSGAVEVGVWISDLLPAQGWPESQSVRLVDGETETVLFSSDCVEVEAEATSSLVFSVRSGAAPQPAVEETDSVARGETFLRTSSSMPGLGWTLFVASGPNLVREPLNRLVFAYWVFVLGLAGSTVLAFSMLLGRVTSSLRDLTRAAEEIGEGELYPWLPLPPSGEVGRLTLAFDKMLARLRQMMAQVDQSGRLAVVGQLSAYLAHEIRNPLSSIKLNLQRLLRWARSGRIPEYCVEPLEISLNEVERLNSAVNAVLQLSRSQDGPREVVELHTLLDEAGALLADRFRRRGVDLQMDLDAGADWVLARSGQVKSVILNLMVNALEAQPEGGRLSIRSDLTRDPGGGGPAVALHFQDEGPGVPAEIREKIFEPFFTTKRSGSGIGLAVAAQAVRDNSGHIYLAESTTAEGGAEFVVVFPLAAMELPGRGEGRGKSQDWVPGSVSVSEAEPAGGLVVPVRGRVPPHLLTPEGVRTVMALSPREPEEIN
jgi:signal transduction histidine kinase